MRDRLFSAEGLFDLSECGVCGMVWLDPVPAEMGSAYDDYYTHESAAETGALVRALRLGIPAAACGYGDARLPPFERRLGALLARLGPLREVGERGVLGLRGEARGRLLDVGCGAGDLAARMKALGWQVEGVEPDARAAERTRERLGGDAVHADLESAQARGAGRFDVVALDHVIEHVGDPVETLAGCARLMRPGGRLVAATPNAESLGRQRFGENWVHWDPPRHLQVFSASGLRRVIERAGLALRQISTPSSTAHYAYQASELLRRRGRLPGASVDSASLLLRTRALLWWAHERRAVLRGDACGEELLAVAEAPGGSG